MIRGRTFFVLFLLVGLLLLLLAGAASISFGAARMDISTAWSAIFAFNPEVPEHQIIQTLRFPRTIADIVVGISLSVAGAIMQGTTRNPLADSGLMGVNSGAAFTMVLVLAFMPGIGYTESLLMCFLGAGLGAGMTYLVASLNKRGMTPQRLVLAGMSISMLFGALGTFFSIQYNLGQALYYWTSGSVAGASWSELAFVAPWFVGGLGLAIALSPSIAILNLGDEIAKGFGQRTVRVKLLSTIAVLLLSGLSAALVGPVGFVGLIVPHIMRFMIGVDYRYIIPASAVYGGVFMLAADLIGRLVNRPNEMALGIVFAILGVPLFLIISNRMRRGLE
ncbi:ferrichrome ABC transporter permease [Paenibacillus selenitireducens]|uniref:Ferrichrome ABC transporter permease n=2 Tax=Paenibacillus selenitireducens TaxID=1324314 RepID=A0A1T2XNR1_9BACL|nr:ferrichrome ABC transporter permease [Paenibacillus selenitireducens]